MGSSVSTGMCDFSEANGSEDMFVLINCLKRPTSHEHLCSGRCHYELGRYLRDVTSPISDTFFF